MAEGERKTSWLLNSEVSCENMFLSWNIYSFEVADTTKSSSGFFTFANASAPNVTS